VVAEVPVVVVADLLLLGSPRLSVAKEVAVEESCLALADPLVVEAPNKDPLVDQITPRAREEHQMAEPVAVVGEHLVALNQLTRERVEPAEKL